MVGVHLKISQSQGCFDLSNLVSIPKQTILWGQFRRSLYVRHTSTFILGLHAATVTLCCDYCCRTPQLSNHYILKRMSKELFYSDSELEMLSCQPSGIVMDTLCYPKVSFGLCGMDLSFDISEHSKFMEIPYWDVIVQK